MAEKVLALFFLLLSLIYLFLGRELAFGALDSPKSGFLPTLVGITAAVLAFIIAGKPGRPRTAKNPAEENWTKFIFVVIGLLIYLVILNFVGYFSATFIIMFYLLKVADTEGWLIPLAVSAGSAAGFYLLFGRYLGVYLP